MHPADIKASLEKKGRPCAWIARELGVTPTSVSRVIKGDLVSRRIASRIATELGVSLNRLWPGKYTSRSRLAQAA